jgi:hypothetical protein
MTIPMYGVWIKGQGWLRSNGKPFATDNKAIAIETARRVKSHVYYIDDSLANLEREFLEMEKSRVRGVRLLFLSWLKRLQVGGK